MSPPNFVCFNPNLLNYISLVPDIPLPSLSLMSSSGNLFLLGTLVHLYCFWILLNAVCVYTLHFLHLVSLSQCEGLQCGCKWRGLWCFWMECLIHCMYLQPVFRIKSVNGHFEGVSNACLFWGVQETLGFRCLEGWFSWIAAHCSAICGSPGRCIFTNEQPPYRLCFQRL